MPRYAIIYKINNKDLIFHNGALTIEDAEVYISKEEAEKVKSKIVEDCQKILKDKREKQNSAEENIKDIYEKAIKENELILSTIKIEKIDYED